MRSQAHARYLRIAPFKVREVIPLIKGKPVRLAGDILEAMNKKGAYLLKKVLHSAVANAKVKGFDETTLFISKVIANPGPALKRYRAATFGRAGTVRKRLAHISIELDTNQKIVKKAKEK